MWGLAPVATRALVQHVDPLPLLVMRVAIASIALAPFGIPLLRRADGRAVAHLAVAGLFGILGYNLPVTYSQARLPASTAGLLLATEPIWILILSHLLRIDKATPRIWCASAVALAGVAVLTRTGTHTAQSRTHTIEGAALVLLATFSFAAHTLVIQP